MGLLPAFRGRGLGATLTSATLTEARRRRLVRIELTVHEDNSCAVALYERFGFKTEGVLKDAVRLDGRYKDDLILMAIVDRSVADKI